MLGPFTKPFYLASLIESVVFSVLVLAYLNVVYCVQLLSVNNRTRENEINQQALESSKGLEKVLQVGVTAI